MKPSYVLNNHTKKTPNGTRNLVLFQLICSTCLVLGADVAMATALPENGQIVGGQAVLDYSQENQLHITQSTQRAVINWDSFNIGADGLVQFHQPNTSAMVVNRVVGAGQDPSQILGQMRANGQVMVLDRNGVIFGKDSIIDVGGIIVSTHDIDMQSFMSGDAHLVLNSVGGNGAIVNEGHISVAQAGLAAFVAPHVQNNGVITAKAGRVQIGAATTATLDLYGDGLLEVAVSDPVSNAQIINTGEIQAEGGVVHITASAAKGVVDHLINMDGVVNVSSVSQVGGRIILEGANTVVSGALNADGGAGGGEILVGGDYMGGGTMRHADHVGIADGANITANATDVGSGGKIIIWSDESTKISGNFEAKGGANGGDGGFIETSSSGQVTIDKDTKISVSAPKGNGGQWLLDPEDITISDTGLEGDAGASKVATSTINTTLNGGGSVTLTTNAAIAGTGNIALINATIDKSVANNDATLTLQAAKNITMSNSTISSTSGDSLSVVLNADRDANTTGAIYLENSTIDTSGGSFVAGGGLTPLTVRAYGTDDGVRDHGIELNNTSILTGGGNVNMMGRGQQGGSSNYGLYLHTGSEIITTSGIITLNGEGTTSGNGGSGIVMNSVTLESETGGINLNGQGRSSANGGSGMNITASVIESTGTGADAANINLVGIGSNRNYSIHGVDINNTQVKAVAGDILIDGTAPATGAHDNFGIFLRSNAVISTSGSGQYAGDITLIGNNVSGTYSNHGMYLGASTISVNDGDISITGTGGGKSATSYSNFGIYVQSATIRSTGDDTDGYIGSIVLDGTGGAFGDTNHGISFNSSTAVVTSVDANIEVIGRGGGSGLADSDNNYGISMNNASRIETTGKGTITIEAEGRDGAGINNHGFAMFASGSANARVISANGDISITGTAVNGNGIHLLDNGNVANFLQIQSNGAGDIYLEGRSTNNDALYLNEYTRIRAMGDGDVTFDLEGARAAYMRRAMISANTGDVNFTGVSSGADTYEISSGVSILSTSGDVSLSANKALHISDTASIGATAKNLSIIADDFNVSAGTADLFAGEELTFKPFTASRSIGIGGGAGDLNISDAELAMLNAGTSLILGDAANGSGAVNLQSVDISGESYDALEVYGGSITTSALVGRDSVVMIAKNGAVTLNGQVSASGAGNSVVFVGDSFVNTAGASAINAGAGCYLVYVDQISDLTAGGLSASNYYGASFAANAPATIPGTNSRFVYQQQPVLRVVAQNAVGFVGRAFEMSYTIEGVRAGDSAAAAYTGTAALAFSGSGGGYTVTPSLGSLQSPSGYEFSFSPGTVTLLRADVGDTNRHRPASLYMDGDRFIFAEDDFTSDVVIEEFFSDGVYDFLQSIEASAGDDAGAAPYNIPALGMAGFANCLVIDAQSGVCLVSL